MILFIANDGTSFKFGAGKVEIYPRPSAPDYPTVTISSEALREFIEHLQGCELQDVDGFLSLTPPTEQTR